MGNGTSIGKFNGLTTAGGDLFFDALALSRNAGFLSRNPGALIGNPDALGFDTAALSFDPVALKFDPETLSFDTETLRFEPDALRFEVFHQRLDSNRLVFSHLRNICKNRQRIGRAALLRGLGRPAGRPYHKTVSSKPPKFAFPNFQLLTLNSQ
jgi:hypothetical protein